MQRKKKSLPFERKSTFNQERDHYLDEDGNYVYTKWVQRPNGKWERVVTDIIPLTAENMEIIILLDGDDHDTDLQGRYEEENADYRIRNQQNNSHGDSEDEDDFAADPIEGIADPHGDVFDHLYPEDKPADPKVQAVEAFIPEELTPGQQDLVYGTSAR